MSATDTQLDGRLPEAGEQSLVLRIGHSTSLSTKNCAV